MQQMNKIKIAQIDLNLLIILDALLAERHLSRAAARIGRSQPAMSHALRRLRGLFNDPLLVRAKGGMRPTQRALDLEAPVRAVLSEVTALTGLGGSFDPGSALRTFRLAMSDYNARAFVPPLVERIREEAPAVNIEVRQGGRHNAGETLTRGDVDIVVSSVREIPKGMMGQLLLRDSFACVARRKAMAGKRRLTLSEYMARPHLHISLQGVPSGNVDEALAGMGLARRITVTLPHFLVVPAVVASTDIVATLPLRVARAFAKERDLIVFKPPFPIADSTVIAIWHPRAEGDPGHRWLRGLLASVAK